MKLRKFVSTCIAVICLFAVILPFFCEAELNSASYESDRPSSFVREALGFDSPKYVVSGGGSSAYASYINETRVVMNVTGYTVDSEADSLSVSCDYSAEGSGLWFVTLITSRSSSELPICAQTSANLTGRARDFLERYRNWTGNNSLYEVINMLDLTDGTKNMSATSNHWNMTVGSNAYFASFYWEQVLNGTDYRGLGITFAGKYVFFRDDRNLPFPPSEPPKTIFTSWSPYGLGIDFPDSGATNVPLNTRFTMMTIRPAGILELYLKPEAKIGNLTTETRNYSGYYTFELDEPLQPNTIYTATVLYGQSISPDFDSSPLSIKSWSFTTGDFIATPYLTVIIYALAVGAVAAAVAVLTFVLKKRNQSRSESTS
jgi:hypothetical protein